jgi:ketosteroid isomerase-like protein
VVTAEQVKATLEAYIEATNQLDADGYANLFAENAVRHSPTGLLHGRDTIRASVQRVFGAAKEAKVTIERLFVVGSSAAYLYTGQITGKSGKSSTSQGIEVLELNNAGEIQVARFYFDAGALQSVLSQLEIRGVKGIADSLARYITQTAERCAGLVRGRVATPMPAGASPPRG